MFRLPTLPPPWRVLLCSVVLAEDGPAGLPPAAEGTWDEALAARLPGIQVQRMTAPHFALWKTKHVDILKVRNVDGEELPRMPILTFHYVEILKMARAHGAWSW